MCGFTDKKFTKIRASVRNVGVNKKSHFSVQWFRQKSGGDSAVRSEFVIAGLIFHPRRVESDLLYTDIAQAFVAVTRLPACPREAVGLLALLPAPLRSAHQRECRARGGDLNISS
jgi:hypothetical protein